MPYSYQMTVFSTTDSTPHYEFEKFGALYMNNPGDNIDQAGIRTQCSASSQNRNESAIGAGRQGT